MASHQILLNEKCAIFTRSAELLWRSPAWGHRQDLDRSVIGTRWLEFVWLEDIPTVMRFFAYENVRDCGFRVLLPSTGSYAVVTYTKISVSELIFVIGDCTNIHDLLPSPPVYV